MDSGNTAAIDGPSVCLSQKVLCENTAVIDGPSVCLSQKHCSDFKPIFSRLCTFVSHQQIQFGWIVLISTVWDNELGVYVILVFSVHRN